MGCFCGIGDPCRERGEHRGAAPFSSSPQGSGRRSRDSEACEQIPKQKARDYSSPNAAAGGDPFWCDGTCELWQVDTLSKSLLGSRVCPGADTSGAKLVFATAGNKTARFYAKSIFGTELRREHEPDGVKLQNAIRSHT